MLAGHEIVALVVEDEDLVRQMAGESLEDSGWVVLEASSGVQAVALLESHNDVRLVFTDIQMPGGLDGMALARLVHDRWPRIRIVITSGRERPSVSDVPSGSRFLEKPYDPTSLLRTVDDVMGRA
jgi:two-component system, response regulator PdtaR